MLPPDDELAALLKVIYWAVLETRATAYFSEQDPTAEGKAQALAKCAALTDVIHNIPTFLNRWERWDQRMFILLLRCHDERWAGPKSLRLEAVYENALREHRGGAHGR